MIKQTERLKKIHRDALTEFDGINTTLQAERLQCLQDRRFYSIASAQWEGDLGRQFENKPKFEINKIHLAVIRIINEYRNNRIDVDFQSKTGAESDKMADVCDGLYRADEQYSSAMDAFDNGFEEAVGGGFGAWRLSTAYEDDEDDEDERQRIIFEPIYDADTTVFFDLESKKQDKSDAKTCFVLTSMSPDSYRDKYDDAPDSWDKPISGPSFDWATPDLVWVCEYYVLEREARTVVTYLGASGEERKYNLNEVDDDLAAELEATGFIEARRKTTQAKRVHKYILSGGGVLEDCGRIAGKNIPIIPVFGKRWMVDNIERCMGHVRLAKDAQRIANMQRSKLAEFSALSSIEKPMFTPEQMQGVQHMWAQDSVKNYPFMLVNPITDGNGMPQPAGPVGYTKVANVPPAMAALLQITEQDLQDVLGAQSAGEQMQPNMSGKAVELIQTRLDGQAFIYMSNMAKAIKRSGEVWLSMARELYSDSGRKMKTVNKNGKPGSVEIMQPVPNETGDGVDYENNMLDADFDVAVEVGPSSSSKRGATVRSLMGLMQVTDDAETRALLGASVILNIEGDGLQDVKDFTRKKLLAMGAVKPTDEELAAMQQQAQNVQPDPQAEYLAAVSAEATARAHKSEAETIETIANTEKIRVDTAAKLSEIEASQREQLLSRVKTATAMPVNGEGLKGAVDAGI